jgi:dipeptidyl aminopeptidase/acylaminoacyl peptidase
MSSFGFVGDRLVCSWFEDGLARLGILETDGALTPLPSEATFVTSLDADDHGIVCAAEFPARPQALLRITLDDGAAEIVRSSAAHAPDPRLVPRPEPVHWTSSAGDTAHGFYYAPTNPDFLAPEDELPPLVVMCHGGPTALSPGVFGPGVAYWTSRGLAVLDVNYGGSSGYGRAYRERLRGNWGIVDVADCSSGALAMAQAGKADRRRLAITGGSAGGYTTLASLTFTDVFAAGASYFGVSDLGALARETHKFESRYCDGLVGSWPEDAQVYAERSPIEHVDRLSCPIILLQGTEDRVVPPSQAELMADAVRAKGLPVACVLFEGEGHGFRKAENIVRALEAESWFYSAVFGYELADPVPPVPMDNLG